MRLRSALAIGIFMSVGSAAIADEFDNFEFSKSRLSTDAIYVEVVKAGQNLVGCSATDRLSESPTVVFANYDGSGTISFVADTVGIAIQGKTSVGVSATIGGRQLQLTGLVDGQLITIVLPKKDLADSLASGIAINGMSLSQIAKLGALAFKCAK